MFILYCIKHHVKPCKATRVEFDIDRRHDRAARRRARTIARKYRVGDEVWINSDYAGYCNYYLQKYGLWAKHTDRHEYYVLKVSQL